MPLTEEEQRRMYNDTLKCAWTMTQVKERLEKGDAALGNHEGRLVSLEVDQKLLSGKLGWIVLGMSLCFTAALHAIGWIVSHFWGKS
jgi:hypothetical protein